MFCSIKKGKNRYGKTYKFYLSDRHRDKETGKMKSSDKYIMTLQENTILKLPIENLKGIVEDNFLSKAINLNNICFVMDKINILKEVVIKNNITTETKIKNVVAENKDTTKEKVEIVQAEIIKECDIDYKTLITFDVQQEYYKNVKESLNLNSLINSFGGKKKDLFEIEEEELKKIYDKAELINEKINKILEEYYKIKELNNRLIELNSNMKVIQDIYISCYDKVPSSEMWIIGGGVIKRIYEINDLVLPHMGYSLYDEWEDIKSSCNLDDSKAYIHDFEDFEEINLYDKGSIQINEKDITGSIIKILFSGNCTVKYEWSDYIDINFNNNDIGLNIRHLIDWINNEPTRDYKVDIDNLIKYKEQLYKYKKIKI